MNEADVIKYYKRRAFKAEKLLKLLDLKALKMEYKGYIGTIEYSEKDNIFFGKLKVNDLILYEGKNILLLEQDFERAVHEYIRYKEEQKTNE